MISQLKGLATPIILVRLVAYDRNRTITESYTAIRRDTLLLQNQTLPTALNSNRCITYSRAGVRPSLKRICSFELFETHCFVFASRAIVNKLRNSVRDFDGDRNGRTPRMSYQLPPYSYHKHIYYTCIGVSEKEREKERKYGVYEGIIVDKKIYIFSRRKSKPWRAHDRTVISLYMYLLNISI